MPIFVLVHSSQFTTVDEEKETRVINEILRRLQEKGAKIVDVKVSNTVVNQPRSGGFTAEQFPLYIITYEAQTPIEVVAGVIPQRATQVKYCSNCGAKLSGYDKFCSRCDNPIIWA